MSWLIFALGLILVVGVSVLVASFLFTRSVAGKVRASMPPAGQFVDVAGGRLHYVEKGEGQPIVMIHGLSGNLHNFTYALMDRLADRYRVIAVDRPGCGHSTRDSDAQARLPNQAAMIAEFIEKLGLENPLIVGHSLGGAVSLFLASDHPERVGGLAMVSPLVAIQDRAPDVFKAIELPSPLVRNLIANTVAIPASIRRGAKVLDIVFSPEAPPIDFRIKGGGMLTLRPEAFYAASTDLMSVPLDIHELQTRYAGLSTPMGMLYGDGDAVLEHQKHIQALRDHQPDLHIEVLEGGGHMPVVTQAEATAAFIDTMARKIA